MAIDLRYVITFLIGAILIAFLRKRMANPEPQPRLPGVGPQDAEKLDPAGPAWEASTINHFIAAAMSGSMPGGERTNQSLFPQEYMRHFAQKYVDWAPEPWSKLPAPGADMGPLGSFNTPGDSPPPIIRIIHVLGEMDRVFDSALSFQSNQIGPSLKALKSRIWFGMAPIPEARWRAKGLDDMENIEEAMAIIELVIDVFKHWMKPEVHGNIRTTHNKIWTEFDVFHDAIVGLRTQLGEPAPDFNIAKLWQEYVKFLFQNQEKQARAWVFMRLNKLFSVWKDHFLQKMSSGPAISETHGTILIDHWALMILNKLLDLYADAEIFLRRSTLGLALIEGIDQRLVGAITLEKSVQELNTITASIEAGRQNLLRRMLASALQSRTQERRSLPQQYPAFLESTSRMTDREFSMKGLMHEMNEPLPLKVEPWIQDLADEGVESFGFVIYKNMYSGTKEEWDTFLTKFEDGVNNGWEGLLDPNNVKRKATLQWVDGEKENIPEGDVEAIRKHFKAHAEAPSASSKVTERFCLAITPSNFESFSKARAGDRKGDYRGFITVVDGTYESNQTEVEPGTQSESTAASQNTTLPNRRPRVKPPYPGVFNIIDQLIWTDSYAMSVASSSQSLMDYWTLSTQHPWGVYVGPTTGVRRRQWREMKDGVEGVAKVLTENRN
ncbi:hypothetical protein F5884DRAFT_789800 [Xylogone sp. PMI_703]|nr:hypothetical protein F5884DRAFT_789800 [Xylogone sp. PMI_703]